MCCTNAEDCESSQNKLEFSDSLCWRFPLGAPAVLSCNWFDKYSPALDLNSRPLAQEVKKAKTHWWTGKPTTTEQERSDHT